MPGYPEGLLKNRSVVKHGNYAVITPEGRYWYRGDINPAGGQSAHSRLADKHPLRRRPRTGGARRPARHSVFENAQQFLATDRHAHRRLALLALHDADHAALNRQKIVKENPPCAGFFIDSQPEE